MRCLLTHPNVLSKAYRLDLIKILGIILWLEVVYFHVKVLFKQVQISEALIIKVLNNLISNLLKRLIYETNYEYLIYYLFDIYFLMLLGIKSTA